MNPETDPVQARPGLNMQEFTRSEVLCNDYGTWRSVALAVHTSGTPIVLKSNHSHRLYGLNPNQQEQILSEINMLFNSDHPSFCRFYGCTYSDGSEWMDLNSDGWWSGLYLGQEYCEVRCDLIESVTLLPSSHSDHRHG